MWNPYNKAFDTPTGFSCQMVSTPALSHPSQSSLQAQHLCALHGGVFVFGRHQFNQNFRKFRSKTQWIGSVQPEKFRKNWSTFWGGPLLPVGPVWILVEWIAPIAVVIAWDYVMCQIYFLPTTSGHFSQLMSSHFFLEKIFGLISHHEADVNKHSKLRDKEILGKLCSAAL